MVNILNSHVTSALPWMLVFQILSTFNTADAVGISVHLGMHSGFLVYKYMFFCTSAFLWCVLGGEGKKVATEKKGRWLKVYVLCGFSI